MACDAGIHYHTGAPSLGQATTTHLKISHPKILSEDGQFQHELQKLEYNVKN